MLSNLVSLILLGIGVLFFSFGTLGLIRFPDVYSRLHALTKADNVGLGFIVVSLLIQAPSPERFLKLLLVWLFIVLSSATTSYLIAEAAHKMGIQPWEKR